jgi:DNA-binding MarR family transcriptional regulator
MGTEREKETRPTFPPAAFAVMSVLAIRAEVTLSDLAHHLNEEPERVRAALQPLIDDGYVVRLDGQGTAEPISNYRATTKGKAGFFDHVDWLRRRTTDSE